MESFISSFLGVFLALYLDKLIEKHQLKKQVYRISNRNEHKLNELFERY